MGNVMGKLREPILSASYSVMNIVKGRKRRREDDDYSDEISDALEKCLHAPKRKKLLTTAQYIYQNLFKEEKNSDISVRALGKVWHLHRVYLCQSPYFASMFNGSWKESGQNFVNIRIGDPRITVEALDSVLGSLYLDEIEIKPVTVVPVLATATLLQLEDVIDKCIEVMHETTNAETAVQYYEAACQYGVRKLKKTSFNWLLTNLLSFYNKHTKWLRTIGIDLMTDLVSNPDLYVMQTEFSLYSLLRTWIFLRLFPSYDTSDKSVQPAVTPQTYFCKREKKIPFLYTSEGSVYERVFQALRIQHLINYQADFKIVMQDNIIPKEWIHPFALSHWNSILKVDNTSEDGPSEIDEESFYTHCVRCGRVLADSGYQKWRWTGFNFGLDLVLVADGRVLTIRRHHRPEYERLLSLQTRRKFMIRVRAASLNEQRQVTHSQSTGIQNICLEKNEETSLMLLDVKLTYPLLISVNMLVVSPEEIQLTANEEDVTSPNQVNSQVAISELGRTDEGSRSNISASSSSSLSAGYSADSSCG